MEGFRLGSISRYDAEREHEPSKARGRQKRRRPRTEDDRQFEEDQFSSEPDEAEDASIDDYYTPSDRTDEGG